MTYQLDPESFLHLFRTDRHPYVYDRRTNMILRINETGSIEDVDMAVLLESLDNLYSDLFGKPLGIPKRPTIRYPLDELQIIERIENHMEELVLGVTEACNFRCNYCVYSGKYRGERIHSSRRMSVETAKKGIDFFYRHSDGVRDPVHIQFYGGEPLLEFDLIKGCIEYAKKLFDRKPIMFGMTTNGLLLSPEKYDFLARNNALLMVSLDGPEDIHNRNRRHKNGDGTHTELMENLGGLKAYANDYYSTSVNFLPVISDPLDLPVILDFYQNNDLVGGHLVVPNFVYPFDTSFPTRSLGEEEEEVFGKVWADLINHHCSSIIHSNEFNKFAQSFFDRGLRRLHDRDLSTTVEEVPSSGICIPGKRKLFMQTDVGFYICEKTGDGFKIGDVETGIDYRKVVSFIDDYSKLSQTDCPECWVIRICPACYVSAKKGSGMSLSRRRENCRNIRIDMHNSLIMYTRIMEENPNALKYYFGEESNICSL